QHLCRLGFGLGLLGANLLQQGFGFGAQAGGFIKLALDFRGGGVQLAGDGSGDLHQDQDAEEDNETGTDPEFRVGEAPERAVEEGRHQAAPLTAASASAAVAALPVSFSTMAAAVSDAMAETLDMAA